MKNAPKHRHAPAPGSLAYRVIQFFIACADEELSSADVSTKFDCPRYYVANALQHAVVIGWLDRRKVMKVNLYSAGPRVLAGDTLDKPAPAPKARKPRRTPASRAAFAKQLAKDLLQLVDKVNAPPGAGPITVALHIHIPQGPAA